MPWLNWIEVFMRKTIFAVGATVCILVAEPLAFSVAISFAIYHAILVIGHGNLI